MWVRYRRMSSFSMQPFSAAGPYRWPPMRIGAAHRASRRSDPHLARAESPRDRGGRKPGSRPP